MTGITSDRDDPRLTHGVDHEPIGQAEVYLVLSDEERAKGFVRPVRPRHMHNTLPALTPVVLSLAATAADVPDMERALRAVLALHSRTGWGMESLCDHCFNGIEERVDWPCPTVRVIEEALHA